MLIIYKFKYISLDNLHFPFIQAKKYEFLSDKNVDAITSNLDLTNFFSPNLSISSNEKLLEFPKSIFFYNERDLIKK